MSLKSKIHSNDKRYLEEMELKIIPSKLHMKRLEKIFLLNFVTFIDVTKIVK